MFAGEYAAQTSGQVRPDNRSNWEAALAAAAFVTGLERNADVVAMSSYAPLLAHVDAWQWTPNLVWFDNLRSYGTPSYYVQKLYATNRGAHVLPLAVNGSETTETEPSGLELASSHGPSPWCERATRGRGGPRSRLDVHLGRRAATSRRARGRVLVSSRTFLQ